MSAGIVVLPPVHITVCVSDDYTSVPIKGNVEHGREGASEEADKKPFRSRP